MIVKLSALSESEKEKYFKYYNEVLLTGASGFKVLEPTKDFDENGLKFPINYLHQLGINNVFFPLEIMAEYADIVTTTSINKDDKYFIFDQIINYEFNIESVYPLLNATSIGNMAYVALNCKSQAARQICEDQLNQIFVKAKGELLAAINERIS